MNGIISIGLEIAENSFAVHGFDADGKTVLTKALKRPRSGPSTGQRPILDGVKYFGSFFAPNWHANSAVFRRFRAVDRGNVTQIARHNMLISRAVLGRRNSFT